MAQLYPFTDPIKAQETPPKVMVSGQGCYVTDSSGRRYLDAVAGLWCASLGFDNAELIEAAHAQMKKLPYYHSFMGRTAEPSEKLAAKLVSVLPEGMTRVFFGSGGSDAVETAVKITRFYRNALGQIDKKRLIARDGAYHGSGLDSAALTGLDYCHNGFDLPGPMVLRTGRPHFYRDAEPGESEIAFAKRRARELDSLIRDADPATVSAFIGEPVMGSGGMITPPQGYWAEIQNVLARHDILLIADEVITGFGRTGHWFASTGYDMRPDLMTMAKQLSSAYFPISAVGVHQRIYDVVAEAAHEQGTFGHGFTYGGHPVGAAVALRTIEIYERMGLEGHVRALSAHLEGLLAPVRQHPAVGEVRISGLMAAVELTPAAGQDGAVAQKVLKEAEARGVLFRAKGDILMISPPLIITPDELDDAIAVLRDSLDAATAD